MPRLRLPQVTPSTVILLPLFAVPQHNSFRLPGSPTI
jgi:hypothetical protein